MPSNNGGFGEPVQIMIDVRKRYKSLHLEFPRTIKKEVLSICKSKKFGQTIYFEAFDEQWKDAQNSNGSENHFGLFTLNGEAKFPIWTLVDKGVFDGLTRNGNSISKTFNGNVDALMHEVLVPNTSYNR